ncbi:sensor histidine kinase [Micromonospora sp. NPDC049523]|uniref:sensor histidine kinase n=1 Tax=Micromonospora sp. NPDC049523 TaxID=3155921 RepID=UPI0034160B26
MDAISQSFRAPLRDRLPLPVWTALAWAGVLVFPLVLAVTVVNGSNDGLLGLDLLGVPQRYLLPAITVALPATLLRRQPLVTLGLTLVSLVVVTTTLQTSQPGYAADLRNMHLLAIGVAVGFVAATRTRRVSVVAAALALVVQLGSGLVIGGFGPATRPEVPTLALLTAWMIGNSVRTRRRYAEAVRAQHAAQAVTAERLRIARELHDMVAHSIGVIAIQAGVGSRVMDTQPAEARNALRTIEATSRETLAGLRRVLVGLRRGGEQNEADPPPPPAPGLDDLDRLAATTSKAGVRVEVRWQGERRPLPADIELSAYRIVQEAVTNVVRHAGTPRCRVTVDYRDEELRIDITDSGRGCPLPGTGYGITGMRERVGLLHGEFTAGPRPEGGFQVTAALPLPVPARSPGRLP